MPPILDRLPINIYILRNQFFKYFKRYLILGSLDFKINFEKLYFFSSFFFMSILSLSCSNKPVEKEMKMPILFDIKEQAEKEAYKFDCEGAHQMGDKWMPCCMHKHYH